MKSETTLNQYTLREILDSAGNTKVFKAVHNHQIFAIKCITRVEQNDYGFDVFSNEAKALSRLSHKNIVRLHDHGDKGKLKKEDGSEIFVPYLVLELAEKREVFDYVAFTGKFSEKLARHYFKQLIAALETVHSQGLSHSDLKLENMLLDAEHCLKLVDFGFSGLAMGADGKGLNVCKGTHGYMAPEIYTASYYSGVKADIFALGVVLFTMVSATRPFAKAAFQDNLYKKFCQDNSNYWICMERSKKKVMLSEDLKNLIKKLLEFDAKSRLTIDQIKQTAWYNGQELTSEEVKEEMGKRYMTLQKMKA